MHKVTLIRGDGVGPELADVAKKVIDATGVSIEWDEVDAGADVMDKEGTPLPDSVLESIKKNKVALKAPITTPIGTGFRSVNVELRKRLNLFACVRPCKYYKGVRSRLKNPELVDVVIVRENTEDLYAGIEFEKDGKDTAEFLSFVEKISGTSIATDSGVSLKPISVTGSEQIIRHAFDYAKNNGRKKVSVTTKANILKYSDGLFKAVGEKIASLYSEIEHDHVLIDNLCMQLIKNPEKFDVIVAPNLYGDILSDLCAGLVGGLGVAPGANIGNEYAVFEPTHGSAPKYRGMNKVNPTAILLSGVLMLRYLGEKEAADKLENAIAQVIEEGKSVTYDLKPSRDDPSAVGTKEMGDAIIRVMS